MLYIIYKMFWRQREQRDYVSQRESSLKKWYLSKVFQTEVRVVGVGMGWSGRKHVSDQGHLAF